MDGYIYIFIVTSFLQTDNENESVKLYKRYKYERVVSKKKLKCYKIAANDKSLCAR